MLHNNKNSLNNHNLRFRFNNQKLRIAWHTSYCTRIYFHFPKKNAYMVHGKKFKKKKLNLEAENFHLCITITNDPMKNITAAHMSLINPQTASYITEQLLTIKVHTSLTDQFKRFCLLLQCIQKAIKGFLE